MARWPATADELIRVQEDLAASHPEPWLPSAPAIAVAGCFVCFPRHKSGAGDRGDRGWAAAALVRPGQAPATAVVRGEASAPYAPGLLAMREGALLEAAVRALPLEPDVLLVNATSRDHPRRAGLAVQLGAILGLPSIGVTHRPLLAEGDWPPDQRGASADLRIDGEAVAFWLRTRAGTRPLVVHPAWRTDRGAATEIILQQASRFRTPQALRLARQAARWARAGNRGR